VKQKEKTDTKAPTSILWSLNHSRTVLCPLGYEWSGSWSLYLRFAVENIRIL